MKLVKMSLAAAMLMGASAFAIDNVKVSGDAKLYYHTDDSNSGTLFDKKNAAGQAAVGVGISTDLTTGVSAGAHLTALTTLGLQGQLVNSVWEGNNGVDDSFWFDEAWMAGTVGNTTGKIGRMALDTPLVFTETWSIAKNTFEAAVVINQDIPDTTLVGAYVGGSNGTGLGSTSNAAGIAGVVRDQNANGTTNFGQFYNGAFAVGAVNNSWAPLTAQAWYYDATQVITAYWVQADLNMEGIIAGLQYTAQEANGASSQTAAAIKLGYAMKDIVTISAAYSMVDDETNGIGHTGVNYATAASNSGPQSKLYTEMWWNFGQVSATDTTSFNVVVESPVNGIVDLYASYTSADHGDKAALANTTANELALTASKSFGPLDTTLAYINYDSGVANSDTVNTVQAYLTYNF